MKPLKGKDVRAMTNAERSTLLKELRSNLLAQRTERVSPVRSENFKSSDYRTTKQNIARVLTIAKEQGQMLNKAATD